ncbi:sulfatase-like hydrolase/transferase [Luteolibacter algae]|uniref:Sulfatase-like hydrolase/transferase n=1 Tax=Luteolibacter algae TaxID=454151 RepID=A0ABW5DAT1_9BACT
MAELHAGPMSQPNIVVIYTDDQGYGDVSHLNPDSKFQTPNIDRLIKGGINFTNGHSAGSACTPSRYALMTGRYPWRTELKEGVGDVDQPSMISEGRLTIGGMLQQNGYHTACVGKWHLGMELPGSRGDRDWSEPILEGPVDRGFDYWYGIPTSPKLVCAWFENRGLAPGAAEPDLLTYHKKNFPNIDKRWRIMKPYTRISRSSRKIRLRTKTSSAKSRRIGKTTSCSPAIRTRQWNG